MKRWGITFLALMAVLTLFTLSEFAKSHGETNKDVVALQGSPCFDVDTGIGNPNRDDHYRWAQQRDSNVLMNNLAWKIGIIFNCSSVTGDQLATGFGQMSGIIGDYVSNPACFNNDQGVTGRDRSAHESWARTKTREQVRDNLQWKAVAAMKCLNRDQQVAFFADESAALAKIPSGNSGGGGGGASGSNWNGHWTSTEGGSMDLTQDGNHVYGVYGNGKVDGTVNGRVWTLRWVAGSDSGPAELTLSEDGRTYSGWFSNEGNAGHIAWSGKRP